MKRILIGITILFLLVACSPTFPLVMDTNTPVPGATATNTPWILGPPETPIADVTATPVCDILGNINVQGQKIYYTHESINYGNVKINLPGEKVFCTEAQAKAEGFRKALK